MTFIKWTCFIIWAKTTKADQLFLIKPKTWWLTKSMLISIAFITCISFKFKWLRKCEDMLLNWILLPMFKELETVTLNLLLPNEIFRKVKNIAHRDSLNFSPLILVLLLIFVIDLSSPYYRRKLNKKFMLEETTQSKYLKIWIKIWVKM